VADTHHLINKWTLNVHLKQTDNKGRVIFRVVAVSMLDVVFTHTGPKIAELF